ncbi:MAG: hypothetical protein AB7S71_12020 [Dongiaceae bacterium]
MTREQQIAADAEAAEDALAAGPEAIMAGAADAEAGPAVLLDLLAHELAAGHRLMLRIAGAANAVLDWSVDAGDDTASADLAAGRLAAAASRLMEQLRQGLLALRRLRPDAAGDEAWIALGWLDGRCSPEELQRRIAAAKAAQAANDPSPRAPTLGERAQAARDLAAREAAELAAEARAGLLAEAAADERAGAGFLGRLLAHELGTAHGLMMRLAGGAHAALDRAAATAAEPVAALRLSGIVARLGDRFRRGLLALAGPGGPARRAGLVWGGLDLGPTAAANAAFSAGHGVDPSDFAAAAPAAG